MVVEVNDGGKLETGYYYKDGYCQGFDRRRVESESDGLFLSMRTLNDWHREEYLLAGGTIREASYMRYDQTENPPKGTYEAYEINERQRKKLLRQAYFYLYIAEYIMDSDKGNCFSEGAEIEGGKESPECLLRPLYKTLYGRTPHHT